MRKEIRRIDFSTKFLKQHKKAPIEIKRAWIKRFALFSQDPSNKQLNNHQLTGKLKGFRSINITGDYRAIYSERIDAIVFEALGTHSQLYK
ncbi:MAG: type II toxin-antitoxin system mRNA interferase toxin, RelE/StbE family [Candidatus Levybacteria bacterium]|nr:type II toxin-antitoxin system mRNA interferase toxin, RelE/StbE family [Candidatus Levybacteria bacterium]